jgi:hypothetical protein
MSSFRGLSDTPEAMLIGIVLMLSLFYKRSEMAIRLGLIYSSASLSGA